MPPIAYMSDGLLVSGDAFALAQPITRGWAWGGSDGSGVRVCVIDSGVTLPEGHPAANLEHRMAVEPYGSGSESYVLVDDELGDVSGHGTACAGIISSIAPGVRLSSVRILGPQLGGAGGALLAALQWALAQGFNIVNLSLSTRRDIYKGALHDLADEAYFHGIAIVASAHNSPVNSFPWRFAGVVSVGSHESPDPERIEVAGTPPVEFHARGLDVPVLWHDGSTRTVSGNSFATPHVTGHLARIRAKHPLLGVAQCKHVLGAIADNVVEQPADRERREQRGASA